MADLTKSKITRRNALLAGASTLALGIYGCSGASGNASTKISDDLVKKIKPLLSGDLAAMAIREEGEDLSDLTFNGPDGQTMTMADTAGKFRLVNLWATWCAPCRAEMPALDALQRIKGGDQFEVIAISVDGGSAEKPQAFYHEIGLQNLAFYHDPTIGVFNALKRKSLALGLPVTLLLDENNRVLANMNGPAEWAGVDAFKLVDTLTQ